MYWFLFDGGDIMLTADGHIPVSDTCPLPTIGEAYPLPPLYGQKAMAHHVATNTCTEAAGLQRQGLRASFHTLNIEEYRTAGKARELLHFDATHRFCSICGAPMQRATDISKRCTACGREIWPTLTVAIIVLVRKPHPSGRRDLEEVLLVHARNFAGNFYGLVAGFVETGESLEECLQREVMEETGLHIGHIRYRASQPWPYPSGLMVGYFADYISGEIRLQREELECGGWFTRDNLPEIPGKMSLARQLIDLWLQEE